MTITQQCIDDPDCSSPVKARDRCSKHYQRARAAGEFVANKKDYFEAGEKYCLKCAHTLPIDMFVVVERNGQRYASSYCQECHNGLVRDWRQGNSEANDRFNERRRLDRVTNPDKYKDQELRKSFGISLAEYKRKLEKQNGVCALCGKDSVDGRMLAVDHDHDCCPTVGKSCGKCVRDLLCTKCNMGLGAFNDSIELLLRAISYRESWSKQ